MFTLLIIFFVLFLPAHLAKADNWVEVVRFKGTHEVGIQTEPFTCNYSEWRINWEFDPGHWHFPELYFFSVTTYAQGENTIYVDRIYELANESITGWHIIHNNGGTFYMKISTGIMENYTIIVEQNIASAPATSPTASALPTPSASSTSTVSVSPSHSLPPPTTSPSPTIPEFTPAAVLALAVAVCMVAVAMKRRLKLIR